MLGMNKWETLNPSFSCTSLIHSFIQQICINDTLLQALEEAVSKLDLTPSSTEFQRPWKCPPFKDEKRKAQKSTEVMPGHTVYPQSSASPVSLLPVPNSLTSIREREVILMDVKFSLNRMKMFSYVKTRAMFMLTFSYLILIVIL